MKKHCVSDCCHNLVHHMARVLDDLWRYDQYIKDAKKGKHKQCEKMWRDVAKADAKQLEMLRKMVVAKAKAGKFK